MLRRYIDLVEGARTVPTVGYHVSNKRNERKIAATGLKTDSRGNVYVWDTIEMARWFTRFQNDDNQVRSIWRVDLTGLNLRPDDEAADMSEWSSRFAPGTDGGAWIIGGPIPADRLEKLR